MKLTKKHIEAVRELIRRYRGLTRNTLTKQGAIPEQRMREITGFGSVADCLLCQSVHGHCRRCVHEGSYCNGCGGHHTFDDLHRSKTKPAIIRSANARADHLEKILKLRLKQDAKSKP